MGKQTELQIVARQPQKRPYASKVGFVLGEGRRFGVEGNACLLINDEQIVSLEPKSSEPKEDCQRFRMTIEGFATAGEAEGAGLRLSSALLWLAVSMKYPLRLEYHTPLPTVVYDRTDQDLRVTGSARATVTTGADEIVGVLKEVFNCTTVFDRKLLVSMELFVSARMELTERTRFLGLVSALEPIAEQRVYGEPVEKLVEELLLALKQSSDIPEELQQSLEGRILDLRRESISRSICGLVKSNLSDDSAVGTIKEAYDVRSKIIHEGTSQADLDELSPRVEEVIRRLYSSLTGLGLHL